MANRIKGITVEIGGDTTKLSKALEGVNKDIKGTQTQLKDVQKLLKLDPSNTELLSQKHKLLADAVTATKEKLEVLKTAAEQANTALANGEIRVTSAIADMAEPALTVVSDGGVTAPDLVKTKLELGEDYGMRGASALGKEWYEHSEGFCDALKGKTRTEIAGLSGGDADLKALCTIDITDLQKAALDALS